MRAHFVFSHKNTIFLLTYTVVIICTHNHYDYVIMELKIAELSSPIIKKQALHMKFYNKSILDSSPPPLLKFKLLLRPRVKLLT